MHFDKEFIKKVLPEAELLYDAFPEEMSFSIDTRTLIEGDIFIAIPGLQNDGHKFINDALKAGAAGFIISKKECISGIPAQKLNNKLVILVNDTAAALKKMAAAWRAQFSYPVIGITGSVGKTSTKETIENILKVHGLNALISHGNQNSLIGLPLNILRMRAYHQVAVFELGINKRGEMSELVEMVKPTIGLITCVGHSHMEGLGSLTDIAAEKREIFKFFKESNIGIINGDQIPLSQIGYSHPVIKFGSKITNQIQARKIKVIGSSVHFVLKIYKAKYNIVLNNNHVGSVFNCLAAISVGCLLNISHEEIIKGIEQPIKAVGRFESRALKVGMGKLIDDCYNASPESMKAALSAFEKIETSAQKIAVLGDMYELGADSSFWHRQIGRFLRKVPSLSHLILVGDLVKWTKMTLPVHLSVEHVATWQEANFALQAKIMTKESLILVKGSTKGHTAGLANVVNFFTDNPEIDNNKINVILNNKSVNKTATI